MNSSETSHASLGELEPTAFSLCRVVIGVTFLVMLVTAGTRAAPSVMMVPLEQAFGWSRSTISLALSINLALFGLMGPFAAATMQRFGLRKTVLLALGVLGTAVAASSLMQHSWQMWLIWGLIVGCGTGVTAMTLGATIVSRWFIQRRGLAMGVLTASSATGQLVFLPLLAAIVEHFGWRSVVLAVAARHRTDFAVGVLSSAGKTRRHRLAALRRTGRCA
ncbi:MFS transporter [Paludibacterium denitrificans]|uniref:MFS transporter n=1 Tax=Paludibacterium denitrificans TaxID=2675226 RepID=UPI001E44634E|nr:MFS transporter [Paludibacterium denitrificans]